MKTVTISKAYIQLIAEATANNDHTAAVQELLEGVWIYEGISSDEFRSFEQILLEIQKDHVGRGRILQSVHTLRRTILWGLLKCVKNADEVRGAF